MKSVFYSTLSGILFLFCTGCTQQESATTEGGYSYDTIPNDPMQVRIYTLKNGMKVYLSVNKDEPRVFTNIAVRAGSKNDPHDCTGLAHYLEHMMFKGNTRIATSDWDKEKRYIDQISNLFEQHKLTADTVKKRLIYRSIDSLSTLASKFAIPNEYDKMVSSIGAKSTNAYTSEERTVYINDIPSNEIEKWLKLESARFGELVLRLFHTELETVYEEFNRGQDNDFSKVYHTLDSVLFRTHPYGTQPTIGTGEHLKNPSLVKIMEYWRTYYVPNNIAVCLAGDFNPDTVIRLVDKYFGGFERKDVPKFTFEPEAPITAPRVKEIYGPMAEWVMMGYRLNGVHSQDRLMLDIIDRLLSNGYAGLIDLNLKQKQKVLEANAYSDIRIDYSVLTLTGRPKKDQSLDEVKQLLLDQIDLIKKGEFDEWLIDAVIKNIKLDQIKSYENNYLRAYFMSSAFIQELTWDKVVHETELLKNITKQQIIEFANTHLKDNYAVIYKRSGKDTTIHKVQKPRITPLKINRDVHSVFYNEFMAMPEVRLTPEFVDYKAALKQSSLKGNIPFSYIINETNEVFELYYVLDMGTNNDKKIQIAVNYLPYLGTGKYSAEELKKEFFKLGAEYNVSTSEDRVYVYLSGLNDSFTEALKLWEHLLSDPKGDENALKELISDELKERADAKKNKSVIMFQGMDNYARYGKRSPFSDVLTEKELLSLKPEELTALIQSINRFKHRVFYYGPAVADNVMTELNANHNTPETLSDYPQPVKYEELEMNNNQVFWTNYDMVQTEMMFISKEEKFNKSLMPYSYIFNEYFGAGLSSIVFQEIREAKALAYSAYAAFITPRDTVRSHYVRAYVGTQADKLPEAINAMLEIMNEMPQSDGQFQEAKLSALKRIESERITKSDIFWSFEGLKRQGLDYDIRKETYEKIQPMTLQDLNGFFTENIKGKKYSFMLIGKKEKINFSALNKLGKTKELTLEEIFGY